MAHASTAMANHAIRSPSMTMPKLRWPLLSPRGRALLMMGIMISPCFLSDAIGYCVQRFFYTADEIADRQAPDRILANIRIFQVACPATDMPAIEQRLWAAEAAQHDWPLYPEAGTGCFKPGRNLFGVVGLEAFGVACPVWCSHQPISDDGWPIRRTNVGLPTHRPAKDALIPNYLSASTWCLNTVQQDG
jgi:hypothetical protein